MERIDKITRNLSGYCSFGTKELNKMIVKNKTSIIKTGGEIVLIPG